MKINDLKKAEDIVSEIRKLNIILMVMEKANHSATNGMIEHPAMPNYYLSKEQVLKYIKFLKNEIRSLEKELKKI